MLAYLHAIGVYAVKVHSGAMRKAYGRRDGTTTEHWIKLAPEGTPDILACIHGKFVAIELKRDEKAVRAWDRAYERAIVGRLTKENVRAMVQHQCHDAIRECGGVVIVCSSISELQADIDEVLSGSS